MSTRRCRNLQKHGSFISPGVKKQFPQTSPNMSGFFCFLDQNPLKVETAVRLRHVPSGLEVKAQSHRTQLENRVSARRRLAELLETEQHSAVQFFGCSMFGLTKFNKNSPRYKKKVLGEETKAHGPLMTSAVTNGAAAKKTFRPIARRSASGVTKRAELVGGGRKKRQVNLQPVAGTVGCLRRQLRKRQKM